MSTDLHVKKRRKNLAVLALILAWCALIWLVTMAKMAHSEEIQEHPFDLYKQQRTGHQLQMDKTSEKYQADGAIYRQKSADTAEKYSKVEGVAYHNKSDATVGKYNVDGATYRGKSAATSDKYSKVEGVAYRGKSAATVDKYNVDGATYRGKSDATVSKYNVDGSTYRQKSASTVGKYNTDGAVYRDKVEPNPKKWWADWLTRHKI